MGQWVRFVSILPGTEYLEQRHEFMDGHSMSRLDANTAEVSEEVELVHKDCELGFWNMGEWVGLEQVFGAPNLDRIELIRER